MKKFLLAVVAVFVAWEVLDFIIYTMVLAQQYKDTASLWRPEGEMKMGLMIIVTLISSVAFCYLYDAFVKDKSMNNAVKFGLVFGIGTGIGMGYGTYSVQPITYMIAFTWFLGTVIESTVAGFILGLILKGETEG
ncbi:MAG: hypothetical protein M0Q21_03860 [Ignavibacteriaceae bacterium]|nr:hypothetical protein [Ignavibacteriaceae bacterium]